MSLPPHVPSANQSTAFDSLVWREQRNVTSFPLKKLSHSDHHGERNTIPQQTKEGHLIPFNRPEKHLVSVPNHRTIAVLKNHQSERRDNHWLSLKAQKNKTIKGGMKKTYRVISSCFQSVVIKSSKAAASGACGFTYCTENISPSRKISFDFSLSATTKNEVGRRFSDIHKKIFYPHSLFT